MRKKRELWLAICKGAVNEKVGVGRSMSLAVGADTNPFTFALSSLYAVTRRGRYSSNNIINYFKCLNQIKFKFLLNIISIYYDSKNKF